LKDPTTLSFINAKAVFGAFEILCGLDEEAKALASPKKAQTVRFNVKGGPCVRYKFDGGACEMLDGEGDSTIYLTFNTPEKLNALVNGEKVTPMPSSLSTIANLSFMQGTKEGTGNFTKLGDVLTKYLKATPDQLAADRDLFEKSTRLMFYVIAGAIAEIANNDPIGKQTAKRIPDGEISMVIKDFAALTLVVDKGKFTLVKAPSQNPRSKMAFADVDSARAIFDGNLDPMGAIGDGRLSMSGYLPMLDNLNKLLGKVALYLA
jgi:hypothetical protein